MIRTRSRSPFERVALARSPTARYGAALLLVFVTTGLIALVNSDWGFLARVTIRNPGTVYIVPVTLAAIFLGFGPALGAAVASMLTVYLAFSMHESVPRIAVLFATMLIIIALAEWQHRAQRAVERARAQLAAIIESMSDAVMVVDAGGRATNVNHAAIAMLEAADREEALAHVMHRHGDGTTATDEYTLLERALAGEGAPQKDVLIPGGAAGDRTVSAVASPIRNERGEIIGALSVSRDITERLAQAREREQLLEQVEQERRYSQHILGSLPVGIAVVRADDFTVLSFNEEYDASVRLAPGATALAVGKSLLDALPAASHDAAVRLLSAARDADRPLRNIAYASSVVPDRFYDGTIQRLRLGDGTEALLITSVNVTERVRGEQERERLLRAVEQEQQYTRLIFDTAPVAIGVVRPDDLTVVSANTVFEGAVRALSGRPFAVGESLLAVMPGFEESEFVDQLRRAAAEGRTLSVSGYAARVPEGRYFDWTMKPLTLQDGAGAALVTFADVTERERGEREREALHRQVERQAAQLAVTFEAMVDGIAVYDAEGDVIHRNEAFYRVLHLEPGNVAPLEAFIRALNLRRADGTPLRREESHSYRALRGETIREEVLLVRDGLGRDRYLSQNASPIRAADGGVIGAVVVFNDVTERLEQEREREALLALVEERRRFTQAIFDTVPVGLAVVNTDALAFEAANPAFLESVPQPYRISGVNSHPLTDVLPHTRENGFADQLRTVGDTGEPFQAFATSYEHPVRGTTFWNETMIPLITSEVSAHHVLYIAADVTEQTQAQRRIAVLAQEAAERAGQLEAVFGALTEGLILTDSEGNIIRSNAALARILGLDGAPVPSLDTFGERFAMRDAEGVTIPERTSVARAALGGATATNQLRRFRNARGEERWMSVSAAPVCDEAGAITGAALTMRDVTDERRGIEERERLLRDVEEGRRFAQAVIDAAPVGIAVFGVDPDFTVRLANDQFPPLLAERPPGEGIAGMQLAELLPRAEESGVTPIFRRVAETGEPVSLSEFEYEDGAGRTVYYNWSLVPLREGGAGVTGLLLLLTDATDRVLSRQRIEELADAAAQRAAELEAIIASMPDGVAIYGADGRLLQMNLAGREISGEDLAPDDGLPDVVEHFSLRYPDGRQIPLDDLPLPRALGGEMVSGYEFISRTRRGDRHILMSSAPITGAAGEVTSAVVVFSDITERKRAEGLTTRLGRILDASSNEIYVYDAASFRYLQANQSARRNLGYSLDELITMTAFDVKPEFGAESFAKLLAPLRAGERDEIRFETIHRRKDGSIYPVEALIQISRTENPPVFVSIIQDITERYAAEQQREQLLEEIDERRRFVQTVIESAPVGIAVFATDPDATVRIANDQYLRLLDEPWRSEGIIGRGARDFVPAQGADHLIGLTRRVVESGESVFLHEYEQDGPGEAVYVDWSLVPLVESGKRVTGVLSLLSDVTERVRSRQRIEELAWDAAQRASELETVIASIADGVIVTDAEGRIIMENDASRRLTGVGPAVSSDLALRADARRLRNPDGTPTPPHELLLDRAVRGETVTDQVLIARRADAGEDRFLMCSSAPVRAGGGAITGAVAVFHDITEMKQIDQMKDEFVSIAAHELRTPLTAIKGYAELLDRRLRAQGGREGDRKSLGVIRKQTERLSGLVNEMLDVSRIEAGRLQLHREPFDLSALVGEVVNNMRVSSEAHILSIAAEPAIEVSGDAARIEQVLINLISNAITYSPESGEIDVRAWTEGDTARVSVSDRGAGIAREEIPHLFDRFYRAPNAGVTRSGGMGLGLYISREIVARHGGTIEVESTEGVGSTFTFILPLVGKG